MVAKLPFEHKIIAQPIHAQKTNTNILYIHEHVFSTDTHMQRLNTSPHVQSASGWLQMC